MQTITLKTATRKTLTAITALALPLLAVSAQAQLAVAFNPVPTVFSGNTDQTFTFTATLKNNYNYPLYLNADFIDPPAAPLTFDDSDFQNTFVNPANPPALIAGGAAITDLLTVTIPANTLSGSYDGTFYLYGGADPLAGDALASAPIHLDVQAVPEASTTVSLGLLLILGVGGVVIAARKKKTA